MLERRQGRSSRPLVSGSLTPAGALGFPMDKMAKKQGLSCTSLNMTTLTTQSPAVPKLVCLKTLAKMLDAHRTSVRRWLAEAGIFPFAVGTGPKGAIRFLWEEVEPWLVGLRRVK